MRSGGVFRDESPDLRLEKALQFVIREGAFGYELRFVGEGRS
jgi:hypothetical protein